VYGPFFFAEATVTGPVYLDMLEQLLEPQLLTDGILDTVVFQQDGAPCHYAVIVRDYLDRSFPSRWIGCGGTQPWAASSPDLTPLDFFAWGFIKSKVYTGRRIGDLAELRYRIVNAVQNITPQMLESVFRKTIYHFELCGDTDDHHVETNK
jgi:inhibitor of nuclear factor kappa-B kinase subunit alpha